MTKDDLKNDRALIKKQILAIRDTGLTNMFDKNTVQRLANERDFYELVCFIEEQPDRYLQFIMSGNESPISK